MLAGNWKLRFTTAADASFSASNKRGRVTTSQVVDADEGTFTNVVDFKKGKLKGFRVVVAGAPVSPTDVDLTFRAVEIDRRSRFPRLFGRLKFRLPSRLIWRLAATNKSDEEKDAGRTSDCGTSTTSCACTPRTAATGSYRRAFPNWTAVVFC